MKKGLIVLIYSVCLSLVFVNASWSAEKKLSDMTIGITGFNFGVDSYQTTYEKAFEDYCKELGVNCIKLDPKGDAARQSDQVEDLIQKKVDAILVWPVSGKAIIPALRKAKAANIPVLATNSPVDESGKDLVKGFCGPNNIIQGEYAADLMNEALAGKKGKVVEIMGVPGYVTATLRSKGFHDQIKKKYPDIEIIETQPGNWDRDKSMKVMENFIVKYGPGDFNGVYVADDNMGMGAVNALKASGRLKDVFITSACLFGEGYDAMKRDEIYGSVYQSPVDDAKIAIDTAIKAARGEEVPFYNYFDTPGINKKNMGEFDKPPF
jgi:ribose transport system substrate-binding protein